MTNDAFGYGKTLEQAAENAREMLFDQQRPLRDARADLLERAKFTSLACANL